MPTDNTKSPLPALGRGLCILDVLIREGGQLRFNELRAQLPGIQDSSLARILKALESYGYIQRDPENGYRITDQVQRWGSFLKTKAPDFNTLAAQTIDQLVEQGRESAAIVVLADNQLTTIASQTQRDGISILKNGQMLHFEPDHAGAVAILDSLPAKVRNACIASAVSRFTPKAQFRSILEGMQTSSGVLIDRSIIRPGVCRIAHAFQHGDQIGAVFFCLTLEACKVKQDELAPLIRAAAARLELRK